jgi:sugar/nucleoside kinase (ribokinase family)
LEIENGLQLADIVKVTDEELEFITGENNLLKGTDVIIKYGPRIVIVTRGPRSCFYNDGQFAVEVPAFEVEPVDTTGAGDAFIGGILCKILERRERNQAVFSMEKDEVMKILTFAHACGAVTVLRKGVIPALPTLPEVEKFLIERGKRV